jgi:hypothetical protein
MSKVKTDEQGRLILPDPFLKRGHISSTIEYWLDERDGDLILHPRLPDVRNCISHQLPTATCTVHPILWVEWDGRHIALLYGLSHNYSYFTMDGRRKQVGRYILGNVNEQPLAEI